MMLVIEIIIGGILAAALIYALRKMKNGRFKKFAAGSLVIAALVYIGFAAVGISVEAASSNWLLVEILGLFIYTFFAYAGIKIAPWFLAVGWIAHILWDVGLHFGAGAAFVPAFYPPVCIGFDLVLGVYIAYRFYFTE
jgi:hypothetical protein